MDEGGIIWAVLSVRGGFFIMFGLGGGGEERSKGRSG